MTTTKQNNTYFPKQISVVVFKPLDAQVQIKGVAAGGSNSERGRGWAWEHGEGPESEGVQLVLQVEDGRLAPPSLRGQVTADHDPA